MSTPASRISASCSQLMAAPPPILHALHALGVNEERKRIAIFFMIGQPTSYCDFQPSSKVMTAARAGMAFLAPLPGEKILHSDDGNLLVLQLFHLRFEHLRCDLRVGPAHLFHETVVAINDDLRVVIDRRFGYRRGRALRVGADGARGRAGSRRSASGPGSPEEELHSSCSPGN